MMDYWKKTLKYAEPGARGLYAGVKGVSAAKLEELLFDLRCVIYLKQKQKKNKNPKQKSPMLPPFFFI